jgi:hypothetical protein
MHPELHLHLGLWPDWQRYDDTDLFKSSSFNVGNTEESCFIPHLNMSTGDSVEDDGNEAVADGVVDLTAGTKAVVRFDCVPNHRV